MDTGLRLPHGCPRVPATDCPCRAFFFFSSRRRHTRCGRDWSSDVCSSDLDAEFNGFACGADEQFVGVGHAVDGHTVYGDQVLAFAHLKARLVEGGLQGGTPGGAFQYFVDAEKAAFVGTETCAQETGGNALGAGLVAGIHVGVTRIELANHFANDVVEVGPVLYVGYQLLVFFVNTLPVDPMHIVHIKEVAHLSPGLVVDLLPFLGISYLYLHAAQIHGFVDLNAARRQIHYGPFLVFTDQHFIAFGGKGVAVVAQEGLFLLLEVEHGESALLFLALNAAVVIELVVDYIEVVEGACFYGDFQNTVGNPRVIDVYRWETVNSLVLVLLVCFSLILVLILIFIYLCYQLIFRSKGRGAVFAQQHQIDFSHVYIGVVPLGVSIDGIKGPIGSKYEVLAVARKGGTVRMVPGIGYGEAFAAFDVQHMNNAHAVVAIVGISEPAAVGTPAEIAQGGEFALGYFSALSAFTVGEVEPKVLVVPCEPLSIRTPAEVEFVGVGTTGELAGQFFTKNIADPYFVFAAFIAEPGYFAAIGTPRSEEHTSELQ